jgi:hypothetical protein
VYQGLLDPSALAFLATQHHLTDDSEDRKNGRGIYAIPTEKKRTQLLQGLRTQGKTLWSPAEIEYLATHHTDPALQQGGRGVDARLLALHLNNACHNSDGIQRTPRQISRALHRFKGLFSISSSCPQ